ncbi:unnamed protein product [Camellia sinensis]
MNSKLSLVRTWRSLRSSKRLSVKNETREEHSKIAPPKKLPNESWTAFCSQSGALKMAYIDWNATYDYYEKMNVKEAYYLSTEYLQSRALLNAMQGRALLNAIGNLEFSRAYAEALRKLVLNLEDIARQKVALCFLSRRSGEPVNTFPEKVAVQMIHIHPTLCIPELMRNGFEWFELEGSVGDYSKTGRGCRRNNQKTVVKDLFWLPCDGYWGNTIVGDTMFYDCSKILVAMKTEMKQMRISDNVELPASFMDLLVKSEGSLVDPFQGNARSEENSEEAVEPIDEEDQFEELEPQDIESKIKLTFGQAQNFQRLSMDKDVNLNAAGS